MATTAQRRRNVKGETKTFPPISRGNRLVLVTRPGRGLVTQSHTHSLFVILRLLLLLLHGGKGPSFWELPHNVALMVLGRPPSS